ncbi:MAG TPA: cupin domain-containing protein [Dehalococcoidia bacterium]|jgi:hypothetical protein|nr:cupin domain-containing protein [Dehalococcoidia bacterium]
MTTRQMKGYELKQFAQPDEVRTFDKGRVELVNIGDGVVGRLVLEPGWRWSQSVKPLAGTEWCEAPHFQYHVSGTLRIITSEGNEFDASAGDVSSLPSGHDAYVVGDDPVVIVDFFGATHYAE